jgi:hypothetical protein
MRGEDAQVGALLPVLPLFGFYKIIKQPSCVGYVFSTQLRHFQIFSGAIFAIKRRTVIHVQQTCAGRHTTFSSLQVVRQTSQASLRVKRGALSAPFLTVTGTLTGLITIIRLGTHVGSGRLIITVGNRRTMGQQHCPACSSGSDQPAIKQCCCLGVASGRGPYSSSCVLNHLCCCVCVCR